LYANLVHWFQNPPIFVTSGSSEPHDLQIVGHTNSNHSITVRPHLLKQIGEYMLEGDKHNSL